MASAFDIDEDSSSSSDSEVFGTDGSDNEPASNAGSNWQASPPPCRYYNSGNCKDGANCRYRHVCKFHLQGNCRYGANCRLSHSDGRGRGGGHNAMGYQHPTNAPLLTDGRNYQWQLNSGSGWKDIENDHVIEAQYSLPHTKSIKIYNTPYGAVSIDFTVVRVMGKNLQVRRLDDGRSTWFWFCTLRRKWMKYGEKDRKGHSSPAVNSADIERKFQNNPAGSFSFSVGGNTVEIRFRDMIQMGQSRKRKVTRRPQFRNKQSRSGYVQAMPAFPVAASGSRAQWQFKGDRGSWHDFKQRSGTSSSCSVTSNDIEAQYQQNRSSIMTFMVGSTNYKLDLGAMTQTNMTTQRSRAIRRLMV